MVADLAERAVRRRRDAMVSHLLDGCESDAG